MSLVPKVGDTVKITSDISKLKAMSAGWTEDMHKWAGRLAVVDEGIFNCSSMVQCIPTPTDISLGIMSPTADWVFDTDVLEVVEEATDAAPK